MGKKGVPHRKWSKEEKLRIFKRHMEDHVSIMIVEKEEGDSNGLICTVSSAIVRKAKKV